LNLHGSKFEKFKRWWIFARIGLEISSCLKLDNWIDVISLDSELEWYYKFDKLKWWYKIYEQCFVPMSLKKIWYLNHRGSKFEKLNRWWIFAWIGLKISSCLKLDNWIVGFSLDSDPEWYLKFDKLNCWYKMDGLYFVLMSLMEIWYLVLHGSKIQKTKQIIELMISIVGAKTFLIIKLQNIRFTHDTLLCFFRYS
jgi:hypothetical protein